MSTDAASVNTGNTKRDEHLRSSDFFESDVHPTFTYSAASARTAGAGTGEVSERPLHESRMTGGSAMGRRE